MSPLFPADAPQTAHGAAAVLLGLHVSAGALGLLSGGIAISVKKGSVLHRQSGDAFTAAMITAGCVGIVMVPFLPKWSSVVPGSFASYLIATGWMTMRRRPGQTGRFELMAFVAAAAISMLGCLLALYTLGSPGGRLSGAGPTYYFVVALLPAYAAVLDLRAIKAGGLRAGQRFSRHIWRMCAGMFVVAVSFFPARPQMFPAFLHGTPILWMPPLAIVAVMTFWLFKMKQPKRVTAKRGFNPLLATPRPE
jgi:hypothetical protein